jgi:general stress protein 26
MDAADAKAKILNLMGEKDQVFVLSSVDEEGRPQSRLMGAIQLRPGNIVHMATYSQARKVKQVEKNPNVQVLFWTPDYSAVAVVSGLATMEDSLEAKQEFWDAVPVCARFFSGPDVPEFGLLRIQLTTGEFLSMAEAHEPVKVTF